MYSHRKVKKKFAHLYIDEEWQQVKLENKLDQLCVRPLCGCVGVCVRGVPLQPLKADGAEEEEDVQQNETEAQPAVQLPAVQMDTQDLRREDRRDRQLHVTALPYIYIIITM